MWPEDILKQLLQRADQTRVNPRGAVAEQTAHPATPFSSLLYDTFTPWEYPGTDRKAIQDMLNRVYMTATGRNDQLPPGERRDKAVRSATHVDAIVSPLDEDAWRLFLGLPQTFNSFEESPYRPTDAKDSSVRYLRRRGGIELFGAYPGQVKETVEQVPERGRRVIGGPSYMGEMTLSRGKDMSGSYLSVYDKYDFAVPGSNLVGRPFEIYDRVYYDPETYQLVSPTGGLKLHQIPPDHSAAIVPKLIRR